MRKTDAPIIVCGLGFGDEGKGSVTDALARRHGSPAVIRYNGGPQAGHNVVTPGGVWHCFAQFGAGSFVPGCATILSPHMLVNLSNMEVEGNLLVQKGLRDIWQRITVDPECAVILPVQKVMGQLREVMRGADRKGSCGQGVGETILDRERGLGITIGDILRGKTCVARLEELYTVKRMDAAQVIGPTALRGMPDPRTPHEREMFELGDAEAFLYRLRFAIETLGFAIEDTTATLRRASEAAGPVIFEGAQGALLDRRRGTVPYITKSDTSARNALTMLSAAGGDMSPHVLGILRAYGHRHGPGPFPTEDESMRDRFDDPRNRTNDWQGAFRVGWLDLDMLRRGVAINGGVDGLALTCLDHLSGMERIRVRNRGEWVELHGWKDDLRGVGRYGALPINTKSFVEYVATELGVPVDIVSVGPTADDKLYLR
jgi:adenylosuccinate synthase